MEHSHSHSLGQPQFGRIVDTGDRVELRLLISALEHPDTATEMTVVSWSRGNTNLVISVPHGGTIGANIENINSKEIQKEGDVIHHLLCLLLLIGLCIMHVPYFALINLNLQFCAKVCYPSFIFSLIFTV